EILEAVTSRQMPPWKAVPGYGDFANSRRLSDAEIDLITRWIARGAREGDPRRLPATQTFPTGWRLGAPDAIVSMEEPFTVPPRSRDIYRCFTIPLSFATEPRFLRAAEVMPGNRKVVHHVLTYLDTTGVSVELDRRDP